MKFKLSLLMMVVSLCLLIGCKGDTVVNMQTEQVQLSFSWWGNDTRNEYTIQAIRKFEELYPNIKVKCKYSEWSGYQARNDVQMASNTESDVMQVNYAWLEQYSPDGKGYYDINKLSDYIDFANFTSDELDFGVKNGKLNAIPIALNTQTVYINKTIYDEYGLDVPKTWNNFFEAAKVMNGEHYPIAMSPKSAWFFCASYAEQISGTHFIDMNGNINFGVEDIQRMIDFYCQLVNEKVIPQVEYFDRLNIDTGKYAGVLAWLSDASSYCSTAIDNKFEMVVDDYTSNGDSLSGWYVKPATLYAISRNTEYPEESAILLNYLLNSNEMAQFQGIEKGIPISKSTRNYLSENGMLEGLQYDAFLKMNDNKTELSMISSYFETEELMDEFKIACNDVLYNKVSSSDRAAELYSSFVSIIDNSKNTFARN